MRVRRKKWIPVSKEKVIETARCRYILGLYDHEKYGRNCFRMSKYIRGNDYFIGHFVVVPEDQGVVLPEIAEYIDLAIQRVESLPGVQGKANGPSVSSLNLPLPGMEKEAS